MKKIQFKNQYRNLNIDSGNIDSEERTVELSFSSEEPVERWFGTEILDHDPKSVDLSRLNNNAAVLVDHDGDQVGSVIGATIKDGRGMAKIKFSQSTRGQEVFQDVEDGIRTNVSFGYQVRDLTKVDDAENPTYRSHDWMPFEISIVGVPADHTVGIGRSKDETNEIEVDDSFRELDTEELEEVVERANEESTEDKFSDLDLKLKELELRQRETTRKQSNSVK